MKKLLIVNNNMQLGGVQKSLVSLLHEIKNQYDITLFLFSPNGPCYDEIPENVKVITAKSLYRCFGISQEEARQKKGALYLWRTILAILTKLFDRGVAIFLANLSQPKLSEHFDAAISFLHSAEVKNFYGGCNEFVLNKVNATKKITFLHGDYGKCGSNNPQVNALYRKFDAIAACSAGSRRSLVEHLPDMAERCFVVPNCHRFSAIKESGANGTMQYDAENVNVLTIARLGEEKGIERGIEAVLCAREQGVNLCYHIVGDGPERKKLEELSGKLNAREWVHFYGSQENPHRFLSNADLLLIPSYHEAAPLVIDEARCFGVPVLTTRTSSAEDMVTKRDLGWVCENSQTGINESLFAVTQQITDLRAVKRKLLNMECTNAAAVSAFCALIEEEKDPSSLA